MIQEITLKSEDLTDYIIIIDNLGFLSISRKEFEEDDFTTIFDERELKIK